MDDLIIIGAGWAGMFAAALAVATADTQNKLLRIRVIAQGIGQMVVTPSWISVWDSAQGDLEHDLRGLTVIAPEHPYALAGVESLVNAIDFFEEFSGETLGLSYLGHAPKLANFAIATALGTVQHPAVVPLGYRSSTADALFIGFEGWRDYYPNLSGSNTATIKLPVDRAWDATPTDLARQFDKPEFRQAVIDLVKPRLNGAKAIGFPAVLGLDYNGFANDYWGEAFGVPVFEIPTLPPSVPGTRLFNALRRYLLDLGVRVQIGHPVTRGIIEQGRAVGVEVAAAGKSTRFDAKAIILATGGLYGGGLFSDDRGAIWEPIFGLPVQYDPDRTRWFNENLLDPRGHPIHYVGVRVNDQMQPLGSSGSPFAEGLYAAGQLLAHPNVEGAPLPTETTEGVALATAYKAVICALQTLSITT
ncbi:MAG: anaerobic glycerol-3-phosphate dehydrogenase subunit B [Chloroflexota bacterium]